MNGRLTLPIEQGMDEKIREIAARLHPDAVRNSDGTELPEIAKELGKVYSTYFPSRGDHEWSRSHPDHRVHQYLMSNRVTAMTTEPLVINVMDGYFAQQFAPELECDLGKYWQVIDRTSGRTLDVSEWSVEAAPGNPVDKENEAADSGPVDEEAGSALVTIASPEQYHVYTVNFLARQIWDSTQIYNYLTNDWAKNPNKLKDKTYDPAYAETWEHVQEALDTWLAENPEVDVVRFTTFFYHFTLVFNDRALEKYVDWFGYTAAVSVPAMEAFEAEYGYALTPEDFVDSGYYNSSFRPPNPRFRDWIDFTSRQVRDKAKVLVDKVHAAGREAMMFLGDNWMGTEPYGDYFPEIGLDAVVGSVGNAATCRLIADIPGVKYTEGRFLPYFFPDVFNPEGDPVGEASESWATARRAIIRNPLDRMGYGGYLSLAVQFPEFVDLMEKIVGEFRSLHDRTEGERPKNAPITVGIVNAWGKIRSWQTHMVAHALHYREIYTYTGVIEALAGLPFEVKFLSFEDAKNGGLDDVDVLINAGTCGTAFSGGPAWEDLDLQTAIRTFVANGGGFIGIGEPTALDYKAASPVGASFALSDVMGVDQERHWGLSIDKYPAPVDSHFITADLSGEFDPGEGTDGVYATGATEILRDRRGTTLAVNEFGQGRSVYASGMPYSIENSRLLHRAIYWAAKKDETWGEGYECSNPALEVAFYEKTNELLVANSDPNEQSGTILINGAETTVTVPGRESVWVTL